MTYILYYTQIRFCTSTDKIAEMNNTLQAAFVPIVAFTCLLSLCGSLLLIVTYAAFRELRTVTRLILANMSAADAIMNCCHLYGLLAVLVAGVQETSASNSTSDFTWTTACRAQGAFALFSSVAYFLWTIAIAAHFTALLVVKDAGVVKALFVTSFLLCWGLPCALTVVYGTRDYFGYERVSSPGWCFVTVNGTGGGGLEPLLVQIFAYDVWLYLVILTLPSLYCAIRCYIRVKVCRCPAVVVCVIWRIR